MTLILVMKWQNTGNGNRSGMRFIARAEGMDTTADACSPMNPDHLGEVGRI